MTFYKALQGGSEKCLVSSTASSLNCTISHLRSGTKYRVQGYACLTTQVCSRSTGATGYTLPDGEIHLDKHRLFQNYIFRLWFFLTEPLNFRADDLNATFFRVSFNSPGGNPDIQYFKVNIKSNENIFISCHITKDDKKRSCDAEHLQPNSNYGVEIFCCLPQQKGCSRPLMATVKTPSK